MSTTKKQYEVLLGNTADEVFKDSSLFDRRYVVYATSKKQACELALAQVVQDGFFLPCGLSKVRNFGQVWRVVEVRLVRYASSNEASKKTAQGRKDRHYHRRKQFFKDGETVDRSVKTSSASDYTPEQLAEMGFASK